MALNVRLTIEPFHTPLTYCVKENTLGCIFKGLSLHLNSVRSISKLKYKIIKVFNFSPNFRMGPNFLKNGPLDNFL